MMHHSHVSEYICEFVCLFFFRWWYFGTFCPYFVPFFCALYVVYKGSTATVIAEEGQSDEETDIKNAEINE